MNVSKAIKTRYTCRAFKPDQVNKETLLKILEIATHSPSWANTQPWDIYVAGGDVLNRLRQSFLESAQKNLPRNTELAVPSSWPEVHLKRISELGAARFKTMGIERDDQASRQAMTLQNYRFFDAPAVIYLCMDRELTPWSIFDLGNLSQSIMLTAKEFGLDTAIAVNLVSYPDLIRKELNIPDNLQIIIGIAIGYGDNEHINNRFRSFRRAIEEVVEFVGF